MFSLIKRLNNWLVQTYEPVDKGDVSYADAVEGSDTFASARYNLVMTPRGDYLFGFKLCCSGGELLRRSL